MVQLRGLQIAITVAAVVLATGTMAALTAPMMLGVSLDSGPYSTDDVHQVGSELNTTARGTGTQDPGLFGLGVGVTETLSVIWTLTIGIDKLAMAWGIPAVIAQNIQYMVTIGVALTMLAVFRGFRF